MSHPEKDFSSQSAVELPTPTPWPMICAFGITLMAAGLVTSLWVSLVGVLAAVVAAMGWFRNVFPHPQHEAVPFQPLGEQPTPIRVEGRSLTYLPVGSGGHRAHLPLHVHTYSSGIVGGLTGGLAMAVVACIYGVLHGSLWIPINLLAASALPGMSSAQPAMLMQFDLLALIVATIIHISFSVLVGLLYVVAFPLMPSRFEWLWGGIFAPAAWSSLLFFCMDWIDPALATHISWPWFIGSQIAFGLVGGFVIFKSAKVATMQSWSLSEKMGVEAMRKNNLKNDYFS